MTDEEKNRIIRAITAESDRKDRIIRKLREENAVLRNEVNGYRRQHNRAYEDLIAAEKSEKAEAAARWTKMMIAFTAGMVVVMLFTALMLAVL